jgi:hypothetical protein
VGPVQDVAVGPVQTIVLRSLHPADAALNLPVERHSHGLRKLCALESPRGSFDGAIDAICRQTGVRLGKRQVEELAGLAAMDCEDLPRYNWTTVWGAAIRRPEGERHSRPPMLMLSLRMRNRSLAVITVRAKMDATRARDRPGLSKLFPNCLEVVKPSCTGCDVPGEAERGRTERGRLSSARAVVLVHRRHGQIWWL